MPNPDERRRLGADPSGRVRVAPSLPTFAPRETVRCTGMPRFRSQTARDVGCLLDVDPDVVSWSTGDGTSTLGADLIAYDLKVIYPERVELVIVTDATALPDGTTAALAGHSLKLLGPDDIAGDRLENARELLRYATWSVSLSDRIRLLTALEQEGSLPLSDCLPTIRAGRDPIAAIAALCLHRFVELDLDSGRIGPQTRVAPFRG